MTIIIGYGNKLRGEDSFGLEVIKKLKKEKLKNTQLLSLFQLTPELCLDLLDASEIIFIDAKYSNTEHYSLSSNIEIGNDINLSHHISYRTIIEMLNTLYNRYPKYQVYSMCTNSFEKIENISSYNKVVDQVKSYLILSSED